jgi:hypothetical protein
MAWDDRILCENGACIGVVGADAKCSTCGQKASPSTVAAMLGREGGDLSSDCEVEDDNHEEDASDGAEHEPENDDDDDDSDDDDDDDDDDDPKEWEHRQLCDDGACIGVIVDGRCNRCSQRLRS